MADQKNENNEGEFPGYPHYPANEDIMNAKDAKRVEVDLENLSHSKNILPNLPDKSVSEEVENEDPVLTDVNADTEKNVVIEADITEEDMIALGEKNADYGNLEKLETEPDDLDIPGGDADDANEEIGEEDEENNYYSLGGDAHENLEEDKGE